MKLQFLFFEHVFDGDKVREVLARARLAVHILFRRVVQKFEKCFLKKL